MRKFKVRTFAGEIFIITEKEVEECREAIEEVITEILPQEE